MSSFINMGEKF
jgi:hypothetical protein